MRSRARTARSQAEPKKAASMRCFSSKLHARARIFEAGLNAAQARNSPEWDSMRTVSPASPPPLAMAESNTQGWRRSSERSLPSFKRIVFIGYIVEAWSWRDDGVVELRSPMCGRGIAADGDV